MSNSIVEKNIAGINIKLLKYGESHPEPYYLDITEQAKIIRKVLSRRFPGIMFSVRSEKYSMGCSMRIRWIDGPKIEDVKAITKAMECKGFDGMIDMGYSKKPWLLPDGSFVYGKSLGSEGSNGFHSKYDFPKPDPDAVLIFGGADYIFLDRDLSLGFCQEIIDNLRPQLPESAGLSFYAYHSGGGCICAEDWNLVPTINRVVDNSVPGCIAEIF